jgi:anhydro-N-acetylmuramic acid kinase
MMNKNLKKLFDIVQKEERLVIGLMSGTSLDGLDIALCKISGSSYRTKLNLIEFETIEYSDSFRKNLEAICFKDQVNLAALCSLNKEIALTHSVAVLDFLTARKIKADSVDLIASHGQTIYHHPYCESHKNPVGFSTFQLGDGDHLAYRTGIICISDFRQKHVVAGGQGAPLAGYGERLLFANHKEDLIMLNIGGISNMSFLPGKHSASSLMSTDLGPGNKLMDLVMQKANGAGKYDDGGKIASMGRINESLLGELWRHDFFKRPFPRTTGPEEFDLYFVDTALKNSNQQNIRIEDMLATLNYFTAECIAKGIMECIKSVTGMSLIVSGGGVKNSYLMKNIKILLPHLSVQTSDAYRIPADAKEAVIFAVMGNETIAGDGIAFKDLFPHVSMGKISFPY